jgi:hypothetical protein
MSKVNAADAAGAESPPTETGDGSTQSPEKQIEHPFSKYLADVDSATFPKVHPHADIFPMISPEEMQVLADDIKANGLKHEIIVVSITDEFGQGLPWILDGRNRWVACIMAGVTPIFLDETLTLTKASKTNPSAMLNRVITENLARRQLTATEKAIVAEQLAVAQRGGKQNGAFTVTQAAKQIGVSASNIGRARKLKEVAPHIYAALERKEYKNLDVAYKAAGLNKKPEMVFLVMDLGWKICVSKKPLTPKNQNNLNAFETKEEADARAKEWRKEKADAEAQAKADAEADRQRAEAAKPSGKEPYLKTDSRGKFIVDCHPVEGCKLGRWYLCSQGTEAKMSSFRYKTEEDALTAIAQMNENLDKEDPPVSKSKVEADRLSAERDANIAENNEAKAYADAHGLRYSIARCHYQETDESHWCVEDRQEGGDTVTDYPPDADGKAQAQAEADRLNAEWQTSVKYQVISEADSAGTLMWLVEGYPVEMGEYQTEAEAQTICDRLNKGEKLNEEGYLDGYSDREKEGAENQSVDIVEIFDDWLKEVECVGDNISVTDIILRHLLTVSFEEEGERATVTLVQEVLKEVQANKSHPKVQI